VKNGSLLLSPNVDGFYAGGAPGPFTGLHLAAATNNTQQAGYRSNMGNGITLTGNNDQMYVGQLFRDLDFTDAAIVWSDNPGEFLADRLTFNFTSSYNSAATSGNTSFRGLQTLLIQPAGSGQEAFVGVGDFDAASATPSERLDILNGRLRIRELPLAGNENANLAKYLVTDNNGVIHWRNVPGGGGGGGCEWDQVSGSNNLRTAWSGAAVGCPGESSHVSIGTVTTEGKLTVVETGTTTNESAIHTTMQADNSGNSTGLYARVNAAATVTAPADQLGAELMATNYGNVSRTFGARAQSFLHIGSTVDKAYGLWAMGQSYSTPSVVSELYGIYTRAIGSYTTARYGIYAQSAPGTNSWAGYFNGDGFLSANMWQYSDAELKTDIQPLTSCVHLLGQVVPRSYRFNLEVESALGLPEGDQAGVLADELEEVFPHLVRSVTSPAEVDEEGNVINASATHKAVNYIGLVPYLIGAVNEQQSALIETEASNAALTDRLAEQDARIAAQDEALNGMLEELAQMREALAACCAATPGDTRLFTTPPANTPDDLNKALEGDARHLHIQPNPFTERTTLHYRLERAGRMQLLANSADGKALKVLQEATLEAGAYQYNWETNDLTPGVYYVTLLLDGEPLVKKAVKVMR
jgi:hypothetical protein